MERFEEIYRKHLAAVFRYAVHCVGRRDIAEELTSEAFLALYRNLDQMDESLLPAWLFTAVKNRAVDYWRHCKVEERYVQDPNPAGASAVADGPVEAADPAFSFETWLEQSRELQPTHRMCLILRYAHGMSRAEIASKTGLSETQVKGYLQYALRLLRQQWKRTKKLR